MAGTHIMQGDSAGGDLSGTFPSPSVSSSLSGYIQNRSSLQTGATFYVSSGTISSSFRTNGTVVMKSPISINDPNGVGGNAQLDFTDIYGTNTSFIAQQYVSGSAFSYPMKLSNTVANDGTSFSQIYIDPRFGVTVIASTTNVRALSVGGSLGGTYNLTVSTMGMVTVSSFTLNSGGSASQAVCWKPDGKTLGFCSSVVGIGGDCICN